ncbi:MAG: R3H domain-containing nucleic acid-binding protein [Polyangiaceae bacterium]
MSDTTDSKEVSSDHDGVGLGAASDKNLDIDGTVDPQTARSLGFVRKLVGAMQMDAEVNLAPDDGEGSEDEIRLEIEGPDAGRIIGKRGAVLEAIQYLTTRVAHRPGEPRRHVAVDAEGYRARHEDQLAEMARRLGERVAAEGKIITFDPMNARDRRIVHMALREVAGVRTESSGEGPDRRVQIIPGSAAPSAPDSKGQTPRARS